MKIWALLTFALLLSAPLQAFDFGEHSSAGEIAFGSFMDSLVTDGEFRDRLAVEKFFFDTLNVRYMPDTSKPYFASLSNPPNYITYGVLNGLSGDQIDNPLSLQEQLKYRFSVMNKIVALQRSRMQEFHHEAGQKEIMGINPDYAYLAIINRSHFLDYGSTLDSHISKVHKTDIEQLRSPETAVKTFDRASSINLIAKYVTMHAFAVYMAEEAGRLASTDTARSNTFLAYAFLYNSFADHFLADGFASGHMVVNRSLFGGIINNKSLHDFYNVNGLRVMNLNGDIWTTYGDHMLERYPDAWKHAASYDDIKTEKVTHHEQMLLNALGASLHEVWEAYDQFRTYPNAPGILDIFPDETADDDDMEEFVLDHFRAVSLMPVPFGSDLSRYNLPPEKKEALEQANSFPPNRNFIRSRVANSVIADISNYDAFGAEYQGIGLRLNISATQKYADVPEKKGTIDRWRGYTASYTVGYRDKTPMVTRVTGGLTYDMDFWVTNRKYFAVYTYMEGGIQRYDGINRVVLAPSLGVQPGPLLGLDDYTLPRWMWIPMQFILPLRFTFGPNIVPGQRTTFNFAGEIDLLF